MSQFILHKLGNNRIKMTTIGGSALTAVQAKRFSSRAQRNMYTHDRGYGISCSNGRANLYKQMYVSGARNVVR